MTRQNDLYLREIQAEIKAKRGIEASTSSLCRTLQFAVSSFWLQKSLD